MLLVVLVLLMFTQYLFTHRLTDRTSSVSRSTTAVQETPLPGHPQFSPCTHNNPYTNLAATEDSLLMKEERGLKIGNNVTLLIMRCPDMF